MITVITVNYNTPDLLERLLSSFRSFYDLDFLVIDGSNQSNYQKIINFDQKYKVKINHFDYNIHHGPGLAYAIQTIKSEKILILDSDLLVINKGFVEDLDSKLNPLSYGIGDIQIVNERGVNVSQGIKYLHPACCLINRDVALKYPMPIKHGAPMISTMKQIHLNKEDHLLQHEPWVTNDFRNKNKVFVSHEWRGTVNATGGYHLI